MEANSRISQEVPSFTSPQPESVVKTDVDPEELAFFRQIVLAVHASCVLYEASERVCLLNDQLAPYLSDPAEARRVLYALQKTLMKAGALIEEKGVVVSVADDDLSVIWEPEKKLKLFNQLLKEGQDKQGENLNGAPDTI